MQFEMVGPFQDCDVSKALVSTRWVLTWKMVDGERCVKARLVAKGYQFPDLKDGVVGAAECVSIPPLICRSSLWELKKRRIWGRDIKNTLPQADGFSRDVF